MTPESEVYTQKCLFCRHRRLLILCLYARGETPGDRPKLVFTMFPGDAQVKMVMADTRKVYGTRAMLHRALIEEAKETLGAENVAVK